MDESVITLGQLIDHLIGLQNKYGSNVQCFYDCGDAASPMERIPFYAEGFPVSFKDSTYGLQEEQPEGIIF